LLTGPESRQVLARWAGCEPESLPPPAGEIIAECGNLPLALAMTGAQLRGKPLAHWNLVLGYLRRADLAAIKARFPEPHTSLFRAIEVSFEALRREDAESARRYVALTVLLEDMTAAPVVQQTLWNTSDAEALQTATRLTELSLATFDETGAIRLHDLQLDYVRKQYPDAEALGLIHGAVRLSANAIEKDARQFAPQLVGRLLPHREIPAIRMFTEKLAEGAPTPWLQPLHEALVPPGTPLVRTLERSRFYCLWRGADAGRAARRFRIFGPHVEGVGPEEGLRAAHPGRSLWFCLWRGGDARRAVRRFRILGPYAEGVGPGEGPRAARASPISSVVWGSCRCNWRERHHPENLRRPQPDPP
jgi:hypothetical protein